MLTTIQDILSKRGESFLNKLFNYKLKVYEKLNGSFFSFYWNGETFSFFKKDGTELTKIDRLINRYYEDPIIFINSLSDDTKKNLFKNTKYVFEYFPTNSPNYLEYDIIPKNKLVLIYMEKRENSKMIKISSQEILDDQANFLNTSVTKFIFNEKLNPNQKEQILNAIKSHSENNEDKILSKIIKILNPDCESTLLNKDLDKSIESLIFEFEDDEAREKYTAKLMDPLFSEIVKSKKKDAGELNDFIKIINSKILEFVNLNINDLYYFKFKTKSKDERFNELIFHLFNKFVTTESKNLDGIDLKSQLPEFLTKKEFSLNKDLITNDETEDLIELNSNYEEILKLFILLFKKNKKNKDEFLNQNSLNLQNELFQQIQKLTRVKLYENLTSEDLILPYKDDEDLYKDPEKHNENPDDFVNKTYKNVEEIEDRKRKGLNFFKDLVKKPSISKEENKLPELSLIIDDYSFITKEQVELIKEKFKKRNSVTLIHYNKSKVFSNDFIKTNLDKLKNKLENVIKDVIVSDNISVSISGILKENSIIKILSTENIAQYLDLMIKSYNLSDVEMETFKRDKQKNKNLIDLVKSYSYTSFKKEMYYIFVDELDSFKSNINESSLFEDGEMSSLDSVNGMGSVNPPTINSMGSGDRYDMDDNSDPGDNSDFDVSSSEEDNKDPKLKRRKKKKSKVKKLLKPKNKRPYKKSSVTKKDS